MSNWYLIKTKPKQEKIALANLRNQNYQVYCPHAIINNKKVVLFPGYIFINLNQASDNWGAVRSTKGVANFVRFGLSYAQISNKILVFIKNNEVITAERMKNLDGYKRGDKVEITQGVFKNCTAIFNSFKSDERVVLLLNLMGQQHKINIKKESLIGL